jgi:putative SOS response-associated peptidase YedK
VAIVTAPASDDLAALHDRVPVTIAPGDFDRWLDCRAHDAEAAMGLLTAPATENSPGTRSRRGSIAPPMTTRN